MEPGISAAIVAAAVVLIAATRDVIMLWIRAHHRWRNGTAGDDPAGGERH